MYVQERSRSLSVQCTWTIYTRLAWNFCSFCNFWSSAYKQWRRSVVKSEAIRVTQVKPSNIKLEADRNSLLFSAPKMGYLVIFGFFCFRPRMNFHFCFIFRFRSKNVICVGPKMLCSQLISKFCDIGTGDFRFRFSAEKGISFSSAFHLRPKMKNAFSIGLYIKQFQLTSYVNDFKTYNNCRFWTACRCLDFSS